MGLIVASQWLPGAPVTALALQPAPGSGVVGLGISAFQSGTAYDDDGLGIVAADVDVALTRLELNSDVVVGIGRDLALTAQLPLVMATARGNQSGPGGDPKSTTGVGDARAGLWLRLFGDDGTLPIELSLRGEVKMPLYVSRPSRQGRQPADESSLTSAPGPAAAIGDGQVDVDVGALFSARLPMGGHFAWEQLFRARTGGVTDAVVGRGTFAVDVFDGRLQPRWDHAFIFSIDPNPALDEVVGASLIQTGPAMRVAVPELLSGLNFDVGAAFLFRGRNAVGGTSLTVGAVYVY